MFDLEWAEGTGEDAVQWMVRGMFWTVGQQGMGKLLRRRRREQRGRHRA